MSYLCLLPYWCLQSSIEDNYQANTYLNSILSWLTDKLRYLLSFTPNEHLQAANHWESFLASGEYHLRQY